VSRGRHAAGGELTARVRAAKALRDDFEREFRAAQRDDMDRDWAAWARRMVAALDQLLDVLNGPQPAVTVRFPDGSGFLTAADVEVLVGLVRRLGGVR
jgi:hypothetical protein